MHTVRHRLPMAICFLLLAMGVTISQPSPPLTAALAALKQGDRGKVQQIVEANPTLVPTTLGMQDVGLLHLAALAGDAETVAFLLAKGGRADAPGADIGRPLHFAAYGGSRVVAERLIAAGARILPEARPRLGPNGTIYPNMGAGGYLQLAAARGNVDVLSLLLEKGMAVDEPTDGKLTALMVAAYYGQTKAMALLLTRGANINAADAQGYTPLHFAVMAGNPDSVAQLVDKGASLAATARDGMVTPGLLALYRASKGLKDDGAGLYAAERPIGTALDRLAKAATDYLGTPAPTELMVPRQYTNVLAVLLKHGAPLAGVTRDGTPPLLLMAQAGMTDMVLAELGKGADPNQRTRDGDSLLHFVSSVDLAKTLMARGCDPQAKNSRGQTPLFSASTAAMARLFVAAGCSITQRDGQGDTPLTCIAADDAKVEVAEYLIAQGADAKDPRCLRAAARNDAPHMVTLLLAHGADPQDPAVSALPLACQALAWRAAEVLLAAGAKATTPGIATEQALHGAVRAGNIAFTTKLLDAGADVNARVGAIRALHEVFSRAVECTGMIEQYSPDAPPKRPFPPDADMQPLRAGTAALTACLLAAGADPNVRDWQGNTPLHYAVWGGCVDAVKVLLAKGANPNLMNGKGYTPLFYVWNVATLDALLNGGADPDIGDTKGATLQWYLARRSDLKPVWQALTTRANVNALLPPGMALIHNAARAGDVAAINDLVKRGADVNLPNRAGVTPIMFAPDMATAERLLELGADINAVSQGGGTALMSYDYAEKVDLVKLALGHGARIYQTKGDGTPTICVAHTPEYIRALVKDGADVNTVSAKGSALALAIADKRRAAALELLKMGAKPDLADASGASPLYLALKNGDQEIAEVLVQAGAQVGATLQPAPGRVDTLTPLVGLLTMEGNLDGVSFLLAHGADVNAKNGRGETPLALAIRYRQQAVADALKAKGGTL